MLRQARYRAKRDGVPFSLTENDITIPSVCPVLGVPLSISDGQASGGSPSLDRIDPAKGYIPGNVVVVSHRVNTLKRDASIGEMFAIAWYYITKAKESATPDPADGRGHSDP